MEQEIGRKIADVAPLMEYYRNKLLVDGSNPVIEDFLEKLRELPDYKPEK